MASPAIACLLLLGIFTPSPTPLQAQVPGQRIASRERIRSEFMDNVLRGINRVRRDWTASVENDELDQLLSLYSDDAVLVPPDGVPRRGREEIEAFWAEFLPMAGSIQTGSSDFDASGQMAMAAGRYFMYARNEQGASQQLSGGLVTIYVQTGRDWHIRAQIFGAPTQG
jgi:uncharacterized protein (TIGR02246 family)